MIIPLQKEEGSYYAYSVSDFRAIPNLGVGLRTLPCDLCIFYVQENVCCMLHHG
jgi:hypothetical protein